MNRNEAFELIKQNIKNENLIKHMLATEVCMRRLAREFGEDENKWALAGLLHDIDYEIIGEDFSRHGLIGGEILEEKGVEKEVIEAVKAHPGNYSRTTKMAKALYAVDPLTGLIVAATLMHPEKSLKAVETNFVLNRFKEKRFAKGANREQIMSCSELGLSLESFITICLEAMREIGAELGL
jgi:hypothetical protein